MIVAIWLRKIVFGIIVGLMTSIPALPQMSDADWAKRFDPLIDKAMASHLLPGVAIGIVSNGRLVYSRGFGDATIGKAAVTPDTLFHMASVTKPFVATAIVQLVEQGKVSLDDPLIKYLPYFRLSDSRYHLITLRQMLTHTSGMPDADDYEWNRPQYDDGALERYVKGLKNRKLLWDPGSRWAYSNIAFEILADVIAKVSGMSFEDYIERNILTPVGMTSSSLLIENVAPEKLASGYTVKKGKIASIPAYPYNRPHNASSDLMSSVNDMARWAIVNLNRGEIDGKRILSDSSYDLMWKQSAEVEVCEKPGSCKKSGIFVGLSWFLQNKDGHLVVNHDGGDDGFITGLLLIPDRKFAFILLSNSDTAIIPFKSQLYAEAWYAAFDTVKPSGAR